MSIFDGSKLAATYGEVMAEAMMLLHWPTIAHRDAAVKAVKIEHGIYVPPQHEVVADEIERLRAVVEAKEADELKAKQDAELANLRARAGLNPDGSTPPSAQAAAAAAKVADVPDLPAFVGTIDQT